MFALDPFLIDSLLIDLRIVFYFLISSFMIYLFSFISLSILACSSELNSSDELSILDATKELGLLNFGLIRFEDIGVTILESASTLSWLFYPGPSFFFKRMFVTFVISLIELALFSLFLFSLIILF